MTDWIERHQRRILGIDQKAQAERDEKGGPGSGHHGHVGRPGQIGGSQPRSAGVTTDADRSGQVEDSVPSSTSAPYPYSHLSPADVKDLDKVYQGLGDSLVLQDYEDSMQVRLFVRSLAKVPGNILAAVRKEGSKVYLANRVLSEMDDMKELLAGIKPRGWETGSTWDDVSGLTDLRNGNVVVGKKAWRAETVVHEMGHSIARLAELENHQQTIKAHKSAFRNLPEYFQQGTPGGKAGRSEFVAETMNILWTKGRDAAVTFANPEYIKFLESAVGEL